VHLVRPRCVVCSVELLRWKEASHSSVHLFLWCRLRRFSTLTLWYHVKTDVRKQTRRTEQKRKFGETEWDTEWRAKRLQRLHFIMCSVYAFIQVLGQDWQQYIDPTNSVITTKNAHKEPPTLTPKNASRNIFLLTGPS
jgi:hypothetical protein